MEYVKTNTLYEDASEIPYTNRSAFHDLKMYGPLMKGLESLIKFDKGKRLTNRGEIIKRGSELEMKGIWNKQTPREDIDLLEDNDII